MAPSGPASFKGSNMTKLKGKVAIKTPPILIGTPFDSHSRDLTGVHPFHKEI
jgi:hypothetical protein